jgi:hypothetical protein
MQNVAIVIPGEGEEGDEVERVADLIGPGKLFGSAPTFHYAKKHLGFPSFRLGRYNYVYKRERKAWIEARKKAPLAYEVGRRKTVAA